MLSVSSILMPLRLFLGPKPPPLTFRMTPGSLGQPAILERFRLPEAGAGYRLPAGSGSARKPSWILQEKDRRQTSSSQVNETLAAVDLQTEPLSDAVACFMGLKVSLNSLVKA